MLPFTVDQFFSVFAACNNAVWPMQVIACLLGAAALWAISVARPWGGSRSCGDPWHPVGVERRAAGPLPIWLVAIPVVWAGIGATAAVLLNVPEDLGLLVAGVLGAAVLPFSAYGRSDHASLEAHP